MNGAQAVPATLDEFRRRAGRDVAGIARLVGQVLAEWEQLGGGAQLSTAVTALAGEVDRLARSYGLDPGYVLPPTRVHDETALAVTNPTPLPAEPEPQIVRIVPLNPEDYPGWRLAQDPYDRTWSRWQLQLDGVTVGLISKVFGRKREWEVCLRSCPSPRGPWPTRALAALQGIAAHQRHLERQGKGRGETRRS